MKLKKIMAGLLGAAMLLGTLGTALTASAADTLPTINTATPVSLTIHKYLYDTQKTPSPSFPAGTGEETSVSGDVTALKDVTFTVYKVADIAQEDNGLVYKTVAAISADVGAKIDGGLNAAAIKAKFTESVLQKITDSVSKTTGADGEAEFTSADLKGQGLYLVVESNKPDVVTVPMDPFLVSLPMTDKDGTGWLYDVHAYPKNGGTTAGITLVKQGKTGDASPTYVEGAKFILQKQKEGGWDNIDPDTGAVSAAVKEFEVGASGMTIDGLSQGTYRFIETKAPEGGYIMDGTAKYEFTVEADGKVKVGGEEKSNITVINEKPDVDKEVTSGTDWKNTADYSVGSTVPYRITVDVPSNITKLKKFELTDALEHQTYKEDLKIYTKYTDAAAPDNAELANTDSVYTVVKTEVGGKATGWKVTFDPTKLGSVAGQKLYLVFTATLDEDAVMTKDGNYNNAELVYSNSILPDSDDPDNPNKPGEPKEDKVTDQTVVYTFGITIEKEDAADHTPLAGAQFDLYREVTVGTPDAKQLTGLEGWYLKVNDAPLETQMSGSKATVSVHGLANGTYYLVETKAPSGGYNLLKEPVKVQLAAVYSTRTTTTTTTAEDGTTTTATTVTREEYTGGVDAQGLLATTVENRKGFTLPATGGMGTMIFTVGGIALVAAGILLILATRRKRTAR